MTQQQVNYFPDSNIETVDSVLVTVSITKKDTFKFDNGLTFQIYLLRITNSSHSTICFLASAMCMPEAYRGDSITILQASSDCGASESYYCMEHCYGWDMPYDPVPGRPSLIPPRRTLRAEVAIPLNAEKPEQFHFHYTTIDSSQYDVTKAHNEDMRGWIRSLKFECDRKFLPE